MAYADFTFYSETYRGAAIVIGDFDRLALRASERIDQLTFDRAGPIVTADEDADTITLIGMATCAVAEELAALETDGGVIQSERIGQHAVTYAVGATNATEHARIARAARRYLDRTELMYRGVE